MKFDDFQKKLKGIKYQAISPWNISIPFDTDRETIQKLIDICKDNLLSNWHIFYPEPSEEVPEPKTIVYWDRKDEEQ